MSVRIANLMFATIALLQSIMELSGVRWAGSPPPSPHHLTVFGLLVVIIVLCWFVGAIGLFFRQRLALLGSLIGVGTFICYFAACLIVTVFSFAFPSDTFNKLDNLGAAAVFFGMCSLFLILCLKLFISLFKLRKELR